MTSSLVGRSGGPQVNSVDDVSETERIKPNYYPTIEEHIRSDDIVASVGKLKVDFIMCTFWENDQNWLNKDKFDHISTTIDEIRVKTVHKVERDWSSVVKKTLSKNEFNNTAKRTVVF